MKKLFVLFWIAVSVLQSDAQTPEWLWARSSRGPANSNGPGDVSVATDRSNNVYMTGTFTDSFIAFGSDTLFYSINPYNESSFLTKYSPTGQVLWARSSGDSYIHAYSVTTDDNNNVYIAGRADAGPGDSAVFGSVVVHLHSTSFFLVKYDSTGTALWAKADTNFFAQAVTTTTDVNGNVYVTGDFNNDLTIDTTTLSSPNNIYNTFLAKYDASGHLLWARSTGGPQCMVSGMATDPNGNVYITGTAEDSTDFGNGVTIQGYPGFFLTKYDSSGTAQWVKSPSGNYDIQSNSIATDHNGHVYLTGNYSSDSIVLGTTTLYNPHSGIYQVFFVAQYDTSGTALWARGSGGPSQYSSGYGVAVDDQGTVYVSGGFDRQYDTITFDSTTLVPANDTDDAAFMVGYDTHGTLLCASVLAGGGEIWNRVATDHLGYVYLGSNFQSVSSLVVGIDTLPRSGAENAFVAKYKCLSTTNGIEALSPPVTLTLNPDPFSSIATVKYALRDYTGTAQLTISDILGRQVAAYPLDHASGEISITSAGLSSGVYLYSLVADGKAVATRKMVVEK